MSDDKLVEIMNLLDIVDTDLVKILKFVIAASKMLESEWFVKSAKNFGELREMLKEGHELYLGNGNQENIDAAIKIYQDKLADITTMLKNVSNTFNSICPKNLDVVLESHRNNLKKISRELYDAEGIKNI